MVNQQITYLIKGFLAGTLTPEESETLRRFLEDPANRETFIDVTTQLVSNEPDTAEFDERLLPVLSDVLNVDKPVPQKRTLSLLRYWPAAAAVILLAGAGLWLLRPGPSSSPMLAKQQSVKEILPGVNKAILTLSDGSTVTLDSTGSQVIRQGGTVVYRNNGQLQYQGNQSPAGMVYNTLATPRGGQYQVVLPDGTKVWLNAASRLKYPVAFEGNTRTVELEGQAYFETTKDAHHPFIVKAGNTSIQVLGTSFDVMAYTDEKQLEATLLAGAIKVEDHVLQPGQQAVVTAGKTMNVAAVNTEAVVAWKNGYFSFTDAGLGTVMRQLSRWYDVEITYRNGIPPGTFSGEIGRGLTLEQALKILEQANVHFTVEERRIVILP
ncbi:MAG TPA: FecR domain-containing protein [Chitinophaga sp.]|nr:FecR domain-containing protein [Chitinophaga sp.]